MVLVSRPCHNLRVDAGPKRPVLGLAEALTIRGADLIVVDMSSARQTPLYDPLSHLVYVTRGDDVRTTIVNGRILMQDRRVLALDEGGVIAEANAWATKVREAVR